MGAAGDETVARPGQRGDRGCRRDRGHRRGACWLADRLGDHRKTRTDRHRVALGDEDLDDLTRDGRRHLGVDLVGRHFEQRLVDADPFADLLAPSQHRALGDGLTELRHRDVHCW